MGFKKQSSDAKGEGGVGGKKRNTAALERCLEGSINEYDSIQSQIKALEKTKKDISDRVLGYMTELGELDAQGQGKKVYEGVGSISVFKTARASYTRDSVGQALVDKGVPVKFHADVLSAAAKVSESQSVRITPFKEKAEGDGDE